MTSKTRVCSLEGCGRPHVGLGYCDLHYRRLVRTPKKPLRFATCKSCGERKPIMEIRHPDSSRGKTPSTCHACRESRPDEAWCDVHLRWQPRCEFSPINRPIGFNNFCIRAQSIANSRKGAFPPRVCASCDTAKESHEFRGGRMKCPNCRKCEVAHPDEHWCRDCEDWLPKSVFTRTGVEGKYLTVRCHPCRTANVHGVTVAFILELQGVTEPECAACGSQDFLKIDHDHDCCPSSYGCPKCVRGYLCHQCNTAEGLLGTPERAQLLADHMKRLGL